MSREPWTTTNGRIIPIELLTNEHLINILNLIEGTYISSSRNAPYADLRAEASMRGLFWRDYRGRKLRDGEISRSSTDRNRRRWEPEFQSVRADLRRKQR